MSLYSLRTWSLGVTYPASLSSTLQATYMTQTHLQIFIIIIIIITVTSHSQQSFIVTRQLSFGLTGARVWTKSISLEDEATNIIS